MTNWRKDNIEYYEKKRKPVENCLENALLCEEISIREGVGSYEEGIFWIKKAIEIREALYGKNSKENIKQYEQLVNHYLGKGATKSALSVAKKIVKILQKESDENDILIGNNYLLLSEIYSSMGEYEKAYSSVISAKEIEKKNRNPDNPVSYRVYLQLASIIRKSDAEQSKEYYWLAMQSAIKEYGEESEQAAECYSRYAHIIERNPEKRLAFSAKALKIFYQLEKRIGSNTRSAAADIWWSWAKPRWFPWEKENNNKLSESDRKFIGYGIRWIKENVSEEIAIKLRDGFPLEDYQMIEEILNSPEQIPPVEK